jgi:RNA-directed DNA polymerase
MKESYGEGLAIHTGPESCGAARKSGDEALRGERAGRVFSRERHILWDADAEVMNAIYEADFLGFSYGFRPGRSQHNSLDALYTGLLTKHVNWVLDLDIRGFFDAILHEWLVKFIEHRIADRRAVRLIQK